MEGGAGRARWRGVRGEPGRGGCGASQVEGGAGRARSPRGQDVPQGRPRADCGAAHALTQLPGSVHPPPLSRRRRPRRLVPPRDRRHHQGRGAGGIRLVPPHRPQPSIAAFSPNREGGIRPVPPPASWRTESPKSVRTPSPRSAGPARRAADLGMTGGKGDSDPVTRIGPGPLPPRLPPPFPGGEGSLPKLLCAYCGYCGFSFGQLRLIAAFRQLAVCGWRGGVRPHAHARMHAPPGRRAHTHTPPPPPFHTHTHHTHAYTGARAPTDPPVP